MHAYAITYDCSIDHRDGHRNRSGGFLPMSIFSVITYMLNNELDTGGGTGEVKFLQHPGGKCMPTLRHSFWRP